MKRIFAVCFMMMFAVAMSMSAQGGQGGQGGRQGGGQGGRGGFNSAQRYEQLKKDLNLTDKQVDSLKVIDQEMRTEMQKLRDSGGGGGQGMSEEGRAAFQKLNEKRNERVKKILSEEQYKKYLEQQPQRRGPGGGGPGGPGGER
ncbi:MAG: hypothetical protein LBR18_09010 [Tannerella sp.]|jgi:Spy/CpxP family protein refolding chaperone|nr:hypothetical protein [Tannerella sp.]